MTVDVKVGDEVYYYPPLSDHSKVTLDEMARYCKVTKVSSNAIEVKYPDVNGKFLRIWATYSPTKARGVWTHVKQPDLPPISVPSVFSTVPPINEPVVFTITYKDDKCFLDTETVTYSSNLEPDPNTNQMVLKIGGYDFGFTPVGVNDLKDFFTQYQNDSEEKMAREKMIKTAKTMAHRYAKRHGTVTVTDIRRLFAKRNVDTTNASWLSSVFADRDKWVNVGSEPTGPKGRRVTTWALAL